MSECRASVSVIVPALNECAHLPGCLESVLLEGRHLCEVIVVDGGSTDGTQDCVRPPARLLTSGPGRARQLNAGALAARGDALIFLHSDCILPPGAADAVTAALEDPDVVGGGFHKRFRSDQFLLRNVRGRTRLWHRLGLVFGDQAMFVRRAVLEELGGFREDLLAEDLDLSRRLAARGKLTLLPQEVLVSARRLETQGLLRTWATWWYVALRHFAGAPLPADSRILPPAGGSDPLV